MFIGLFVGGYAGDRFGRKTIFYLSVVGVVLGSWVMVFPKHVAFFVACRTFIGMTSGELIFWIPNTFTQRNRLFYIPETIKQRFKGMLFVGKLGPEINFPKKGLRLKRRILLYQFWYSERIYIFACFCTICTGNVSSDERSRKFQSCKYWLSFQLNLINNGNRSILTFISVKLN